jgi:putative membrane protein
MAGFFADDGKGALRRAIVAFEERTAAELVIAVRPTSDRYAHVPALVGGLTAALTLAFLLYGEPEFGLHWFLVDPLLAGLAAAWLVRHSHALARWMTPRAWREEAVLRAAKASYLDHGVAETRGRTGVFLYVSLTERAAVVLADVGVRREVPREPWDEAVAALAQAVAAGARAVELAPRIAALAELCADALPRAEDDVNELPDEVMA